MYYWVEGLKEEALGGECSTYEKIRNASQF